MNTDKHRCYVAMLILAGIGMAQAQPVLMTPEQERLALIKTLQKRLPGIATNDLALGAATFEKGVKVFTLGEANETNSADILAIGKKQWERKFKNGKSLASCFANGGKGVTATYPQFDPKTTQLVTLEMAINICYQQNDEMELALNNMNAIGALSAYLRSLSDGSKLAVRVTGNAAREHYDAGRKIYFQRKGQLNFACASCHVQYAGAQYGNAPLSPVVGEAVSSPWLRPGGIIRTLQSQFQRCFERMGMVPYAIGSDELNNLEYYVSYMSNGLAIKPLAIQR